MDAVNALVHLGVRISRVRMIPHPADERELTICVVVVQGPGDKDLRRRIKQKQSNEDEYELSRYKPLLRTVIEVRISLPIFTPPLPIQHTQTTIGPSRRKTRPCWVPVRQRLPTGSASGIKRAANANTHDFTAKRETELAPRCAHWRCCCRNAPAGTGVRSWRYDIFRDARGILAFKPAREGRNHRYVASHTSQNIIFD